EQAQKAATGRLRTPSPSELSGKSINGTPPGLVGIHDAGNLHFSVGLYFNGPSGTLGIVHLVLLDSSQRYAAIEALRGIYGEPIERTRPIGGETIRWRDDKGNTSIEAFVFADQFVVNYKPLRGAADGGL